MPEESKRFIKRVDGQILAQTPVDITPNVKKITFIYKCKCATSGRITNPHVDEVVTTFI